ncbi:adenosine deaminase/editase [Aspergillus carlsbadensis]|nr:adenosine deaminase/editase [Aspergillus carlsbadensis]
MGHPEPKTHTLPSRIATLVHFHFDGLPKRSKPVVRDDGTAEWVPMTGIVLVKGENTPSETLTCIAIATGAKCLSARQIPQCKGLVLHDCHAEILAMRAFNFWLLSECHGVLAQEDHPVQDTNGRGNDFNSPYIQRRQASISNTDIKRKPEPPFEIQPDVRIYMYCTCAPCGDASMELCMAAQDDPTPWIIPPPESELDNTPSNSNTGSASDTPLLSGRAGFSKLGIVRRKPARADAESTKSKSCSDKIALRQVSSLLNYETSQLVAPTENAYIAALILPEEEITRVGCERCFGEDGRMKGLKGRVWPVRNDDAEEINPRYRYEFRPFQVLSIPTEQLKSLWPFRKPRASDPTTESEEDKQSQPEPAATSKKSKPSNLSTIWVRAPTVPRPADPEGAPRTVVADTGSKSLPTLRGSKTGLFENIVNGVKQGNKHSAPGLRGASALSRAKSWSFCKEVLRSIFPPSTEGAGPDDGDADGRRGDDGPSILQVSTYREFKEPVGPTETIRARRSAIQSAREVLAGWVPNSGDEDWGLDVLVDTKKRKR